MPLESWAANIPLLFVDLNFLELYSLIIPEWEKRVRQRPQMFESEIGYLALWSRRENLKEAGAFFGEKLAFCRVSNSIWNGLNVRPEIVYFDQVSTLGVVGRDAEMTPKISFSLNEKPFCDDVWFHTQHLVASVSFMGSLYPETLYTLQPPYIPELNEFFSRTMHFIYNKLRIEPDGLGIIIDAVDSDVSINALPIADLIERLFGLVGYSVKLSSAGLIVRQLLYQLGGVQGARVFKIPGVRRLLKQYGPLASFTKDTALKLVGGKDPSNLEAKFKDHENLFIEARPFHTKLNPEMVFSYLVGNGLFRIGVDLKCPSCRLSSWVAVDSVKQELKCELCGNQYDATRQLVNSEWRYRRTGVLGTEKNAQGAIPVSLTLQQLDANFHSPFHGGIFYPSLELDPQNPESLPQCEIDFTWMTRGRRDQHTSVILGECKDQGEIDEKTINNLRLVADAFPPDRYKAFVLLSKLCPFTQEEIAFAKKLNRRFLHRVILLTAKELEPYHIFERDKANINLQTHASTPDGLADATAAIYFGERLPKLELKYYDP